MRKILTLIILLSCLSTLAIKEQKHIQPENKNVQFGVQVPKKEFIFEIDSLEIARKFYVCDTLMQPTDSMATLFRYGKYHTISFGITSIMGAWIISDTTLTLASKSFIETWINNRFQTLGTSWLHGDTASTIASKSFFETWTQNRYLPLGSAWLHADTSGTLSSKSFMETYVANRFLTLGSSWLHADTSGTLASKSFFETYTANRYLPLGSAWLHADTSSTLASKSFFETYTTNRFLGLGSAWLHGDTAGTLASKSFFETYTTNRFLGLGNAWLHGDTASTLASKSFFETYTNNRYQPLNTNLTSIAALANGSGALINSGSGGFSYATPWTTSNTTGTANIAGGSVGAVPYQSGANATGIVAATATANKVLMSGASAIPTWSTPTYPNASNPTSGKVITSDGTNWTASAYTMATPGAVGNGLISDGTNWTSASASSASNWTVVKVAGSDFTTSSTSLVDITGLSFTAVASTNYLIDAWIDCVSSTGTSGDEFGINSTGSTPAVYWTATGNLSATAAIVVGNVANNTACATAFQTVSGQEGFVHITGIVKSGTGSPVISIRVLKVSSGTATVKIGSRLMYMVQ